MGATACPTEGFHMTEDAARAVIETVVGMRAAVEHVAVGQEVHAETLVILDARLTAIENTLASLAPA